MNQETCAVIWMGDYHRIKLNRIKLKKGHGGQRWKDCRKFRMRNRRRVAKVKACPKCMMDKVELLRLVIEL